MYDAIVIGSGIGGMTTAGLLAGVSGKKVLVCEKHTEPGGFTHVFRRDGASWDVGLHYVGDLAPGSPIRAYLDYLTGSAVSWTKMPDDFEHFSYPGLEFDVPSDPVRYEQRLVDRFPDEAPAIRGYFRDVRRAARWMLLGLAADMSPRLFGAFMKAVRSTRTRLATQTTKAYLDAKFRSPELRALLASQWGDYGLPPSRSVFVTHAMIVNHYLKGAWFPQGGSGRIARGIEAGIEVAGGAIVVGQEVTEILLENGKAAGVRVVDRRGPVPVERIYRAPLVISDVGAARTYNRLLQDDGETGALTADVREAIERLGPGTSAVTLYLRLSADPSTIGIKGENHWIFDDFNHDEPLEGLVEGSPRGAYVSFPSMKSGDDRFHTAEIITFVDASAFDAWRDTPKGDRGADYSELKKRIGDGMLRLAETRIPGLTGLVTYSELSTPLTYEHYTSHPGGALYGLPSTPERMLTVPTGARTPIPGLLLTGADAGILGIVGAMMGGVIAASQALGPAGLVKIQTALHKPRKTPVDPPLPDTRRKATISAKKRLTPTIWQVEFEIEGELPQYSPGQFARIKVSDLEWRDYSITGNDGPKLRFLISTRTGGYGSRFVESAQVGTRTQIELPLGSFALSASGHRAVFVATGSGLAPFLPMIGELAAEPSADVTLFFGARKNAEDITGDVVGATVIRCVTQEEPQEGGVRGRVTDALATYDFDPDTTDFYICGSAAMVADCRTLLESRGAVHIFTEAY